MLDSLTLDQARMFIAVAEAGSFSAAARRLRRVQSAVSQSVVGLERALRVELFDRTGRRPVLTKAGEAVLADARELIRNAEAMRARAKALSGGVEAELAIAVDPLYPVEHLVAGLRTVEAAYPATSITLISAGLGGPERHLRAGTVTMAIYALETTAPRDLDSDYLMQIEMVPVVGATHVLARRAGPIERGELAETIQLVLTDAAGSTTWSRGVLSRRVWRFQDLRTRLEILLAGFGWCNLPAHVVRPFLKTGQLHRLHVDADVGFTLGLFAVRMPSKPYGPVARALLAELQRLTPQAT